MLNNKTIIVLGAAGLLGHKVVEAIVANNGKVIAVDIDTTSIARHKLVECRTVDVTNEEEVKSLFNTPINIQGLVNCSYPRSQQYGKSFFDVNLSSFNENINLHLGSAFLVMQQCAAYFKREQAVFSLVNLASIYGVVAPDFTIYKNTNMTMPVEYAAIKSAIIHLNKYVSEFVGDSNFRVNSVSPGGILDSQPGSFIQAYEQHTHGHGMLFPDQICGSIVFLLSDNSKYITGQNIVVDDGFSL